MSDRLTVRRTLSVLVLAAGLTGCVSIPPEQRDPDDPAESWNRGAYGFNDGLDAAVLKPVATAYTETFADVVRRSVSNFFDNLTYVDTMLNSFLQGKIEQGVSDFTRILVNTTLGVGGLFDVASAGGLAENDEDFGQTLAVWGSGDGAYLVYPLFGPSSVRDTGGLLVSMATNPIFYAAAPVAVPLGLLGVIDQRSRNEGFVQFRDTAALDPYVFTRESYLQYRVSAIYDGNPPRPAFFDEAPPETEAGPSSGAEPAEPLRYVEPERIERLPAHDLLLARVG